MSGVDNSFNIISKPVFWYNFDKGQFGVDYQARGQQVEQGKPQFVAIKQMPTALLKTI